MDDIEKGVVIEEKASCYNAVIRTAIVVFSITVLFITMYFSRDFVVWYQENMCLLPRCSNSYEISVMELILMVIVVVYGVVAIHIAKQRYGRIDFYLVYTGFVTMLVFMSVYNCRLYSSYCGLYTNSYASCIWIALIHTPII
jgi:hypothetical protein